MAILGWAAAASKEPVSVNVLEGNFSQREKKLP